MIFCIFRCDWTCFNSKRLVLNIYNTFGLIINILFIDNFFIDIRISEILI